MSSTQEESQKDLQELLHIFEKNAYETGLCEEESMEHSILEKCEALLKKDYTLVELTNKKGILCPGYPSRIFIPEFQNTPLSATIIQVDNSNVLNVSLDNAASQNSSISNSPNRNSPSRENGTTQLTNADHANAAQQQSQQSQYLSPHSNAHYQQHILPQSSNSTASLSAAPSTSSLANTATNNTIYEDQYDINKVRELISMAKYARCRQRFAVPVIMYRGKYICRSATISVNAETYGRKAVDYAYDCLNGTNYSERAVSNQAVVDDENNEDNEDSLGNQPLIEVSPFSYEEVIKSDIQLLNALNVTTIVDLMVEKRKIKYFMPVSSSEKADPENHYENFNILSLPYPGCEFFKEFRDNNYMGKNLFYNWQEPFNDADISLPNSSPANNLSINWNEYKTWDLVLITQNYLKACLKYIQEDKSGILVHCISGWDRTPLFISLLRLSLWADGLIHQSLDPSQMAYFTVAYDWYLFSHQLPSRIRKEEDIMFFCFHVLKYLYDDEFSIIEQHRKRTKTTSSSGSATNSKPDNCDDESLKEDKEDSIVLCDQDSNDSVSNNSNCDNSTTDQVDATAPTKTPSPPHQSSSNSTTSPQASGNNSLTNRSPNSKRTKTSPISVPGANASRQRHESTSSNEGWQVVTETGSVDSSLNLSLLGRSVQPSDDSNNTSQTRRSKLKSVRDIFITSYGKTVGLKFKEGTGVNINRLIGSVTGWQNN